MTLSALLLMASHRSDFNATNALADLTAFRKQAYSSIKTREDLDAANKSVKEKALETLKDVKISDTDSAQCYALAQIYVMGEQWKESIDSAEKFVASNPAEKFQGESLIVRSASQLKDVNVVLKHSVGIKLPDSMDGYSFAATWIRTPFELVKEKKGIKSALKISDDYDTQVRAMTSLKDPVKKSWSSTYPSLAANALAESGDINGAVKRIDAALVGLDAKEGRSLNMLKKQLSLPGHPYPALKFSTGYGTFDEDQMVGKVVILDFFAHWCGPCIATFPRMEQMYSDLHPKGLEVVGITRYYGYFGRENTQARDMPKETEFAKMDGFIKEHKLPWRVMYGEQDNFENYGCAAIPYCVVIDKKGVIRKIEVGNYPDKFAEFRKFIEGLLAE